MEVPFLEVKEPFDVDSFGTLGRMGLLSGFSLLDRVLFISPDSEKVVRGSQPYRVLKGQGWKFVVIQKSKEV